MIEVNTLYKDGEGRNVCGNCGSHYVVSPQEAEAYKAMYEALEIAKEVMEISEVSHAMIGQVGKDPYMKVWAALSKARGE